MRHQIRTYLRTSAWTVPALAIPLAVAVSPVVRAIDARLQFDWVNYTPTEAMAILGAVTPAALTMVVLVLSMLLLAVQLASSQFSPRLIGCLLARRPVKVCLFIFVFTYVYSAGVVGRVGVRVSQLSVFIAIICTMISVGAGLFLIDYLAKELRPVRMLARTADAGRSVIEHVYPTFVPIGSAAETQTPTTGSEFWSEQAEVIPRTRHSGVLLAIDLKGLCAVARRAGCVIEVVPQVGDFVARGDPLFRVHPRAGGIAVSHVAGLTSFGNERTYEQDPAFAFRILVDVACRALSPAINDPTTAVLAIDQIHQLLRQVGRRRLDTGEVRDAQGNLRVVYRTPNWEDFVLLAVTEIRQYGRDSIQVARRLHAMLRNLIGAVPPGRATILEKELRLLQSSVGRSFNEPEDRERAEHGDYQGVGGSQGGNHAVEEMTPPAAAGVLVGARRSSGGTG
jgi:uncharacterized membrane protein